MKNLEDWRTKVDRALTISQKLIDNGFRNEVRISGAKIRIRVNKSDWTNKDRKKIAKFMRVIGHTLSKSYTNTNRVRYLGVIEGIGILMNTNIPAKDNCLLVSRVKPITETHYVCQKV